MVIDMSTRDNETKGFKTCLGTPSLVSSWNLYVMIVPAFGGDLRSLSVRPEPTLNVWKIQQSQEWPLHAFDGKTNETNLS